MGSAISIGTTGLSASSKQMDVIGNNLANANTLGFKSSNTYFASVLNQSGSMSTGQGVAVAAIQNQFTQGSFETTGNATDLAIDGEGFFMIKDINSAAYFTRAGAFGINSQGYLVDGNGYRVQGYDILSDEETDISLKNVQSAPKASTEITFGANLDDSADYGDKFNLSQNVFDSKGNLHILSVVFQKTEANGTWGFDVKLDGSITSNLTDQSACGLVFDKDGVIEKMYKGEIDNTAAVTAGGGTIDDAKTVVSKPGQLIKEGTGIELTKSASSGVWTVTNAGDSDPSGTPPVVNDCYTNAIAWEETVGGVAYMKVDLDGAGGADIVFTLDGAWAAGDTVTFDTAKTDVAIQDLLLTFGDLGNGATIGITEGSGATIKNKITWDIAGDSAHKLSGYASASVVKSVSDNGYTSGVLKSLGVGNDGIISGFFTNGQTAELGQLILANFPDTSKLKRIGNYFGATTESGAAIKNKPGSGGLGEIMSQSLESSNVDVAKEFISMITAQRAYQASSRIITTADQMLTELMNIKR
jgi:flagellar hook protein FlgE